MACCVIASIILLVVHRATPRRRRASDVANFAPLAYRPAPGQMCPSEAAPPQPQTPLRTPVAMGAWALRFVSMGACCYLAMVAVMLRLGAVCSTVSTQAWVVRTVFVVSVAVIAGVLASQIFGSGQDRLSRREVVGSAALGISVVFLERTVVDMDLLSLYRAAAPMVGYLIHAAAVAALFVGVVLLTVGKRAVVTRPSLIGGQ